MRLGLRHVLMAVLFMEEVMSGGVDKQAELDAFFVDCTNFEGDIFGGPVCGADSITYHNIIHLTCLNNKRHKAGLPLVNMTGRGACPESPGEGGCPWSPIYSPVCATDDNTYANEEAMSCHNKMADLNLNVSHEGECCRQDACLGGWPWGTGKVCSSNGRTYPSPAAVHCLRKFNSRVSIVHEGGCTTEDISARMRLRAQVCLIARHRFEVNPVCAADHKTYVNPFVFLCFKPHMRSVGQGSCDDPVLEACRVAHRLDALKKSAASALAFQALEEHREAILSSDVGRAHDGDRESAEEVTQADHRESKRGVDLGEELCVCASDGLTYDSVHHVKCASANNKFAQAEDGVHTMKHQNKKQELTEIDLTVLHDGRCLPEDSPCVRRARLEDRGTPVCGSDGVTYATPDFLACVQRSKDPTLKYLHDGVCVPEDSEGKLWE